MTLVAHDYLHRLSRASYARGFGPLPDFIIASILGAREPAAARSSNRSIAARPRPSRRVNLIFSGTGPQAEGQSHLELLTEIAETYDAEFWVEGDILYLSRFMKEYAPAADAHLGRIAARFTPKVTTVGQAFGVAMRFTLREIPLDFLVKVYWDFDRESVGIVGAARAPRRRGRDGRSGLHDHRPARRQPGRHHEQRARRSPTSCAPS